MRKGGTEVVRLSDSEERGYRSCPIIRADFQPPKMFSLVTLTFKLSDYWRVRLSALTARRPRMIGQVLYCNQEYLRV